MTTSKELLMAILSMDVYNRGYNAGIEGLGSAADGSVKIGNATIIQNINSTGMGSVSQAAGFYALAYQTQFGTVISYRGTDNIASLDNMNPWSDAPGSDFWNGYGTAAGNPMSEQACFAAEFYQIVTGTTEGDP